MSNNLVPIRGPCQACLNQIQNPPSEIVNENTPLIFRSRPPTHSRCSILLFGFLMFILFFGCTIGFYLIAVETREIQAHDVMMLSTRRNWKAVQPISVEALTLPAEKLLLVFSNSSPCYDHGKCKTYMQHLQKTHMGNNNTDLLYNFVIANDNRIYEGRGWKYVPEVKGYSDNSTLSIAFLGFPVSSGPNEAQADQLMMLIDFSVANHKLRQCFQIVTKHEENPYLRDIVDEVKQLLSDNNCK